MSNKKNAAIKTAMKKLVGFSLSKNVPYGLCVSVQLNPSFGNLIWVSLVEINHDPITHDGEILSHLRIDEPTCDADIHRYQNEVESLIAKLTKVCRETESKLHTVAEVMANLESEVNE
jgi:hypothetical protein